MTDWSHALHHPLIGLLINSLQMVFLGYFLLLTAGYLLLNCVALTYLTRYMAERRLSPIPRSALGLDPPISILVPAYNEALSITGSLKSLLQLEYHEFQIVVINDGSSDTTLDVLRRDFDLIPFPYPYRMHLPTQPIRTLYRSRLHPTIYVIDKANGGKADALNAGINFAQYPLFCSLDADSILQRDSLLRVVQPFLEDPRTVACGGTCRVANGCEVTNGLLTKVGMPRNPLALIQVVEYLRAFLFGRLGWSPLNAMLIVSGAFGVFRKNTVCAVGGYQPDTIGEDMDLVVRLHRHLRLARTPYRITFVPDPVCWTEGPEDLRTLKNQRVRWQRGLGDSLMNNLVLLCHPKAGAVGWLAFPFFILFEWIGPLLEVIGYMTLTLGMLAGIITLKSFLVFLLIATSCGILLSISALLLEEISFHVYDRPRHLIALFGAAIIENLGYRQLTTCWRLIGLYRWVKGGKAQWGTMIRRASWQSTTQPS